MHADASTDDPLPEGFRPVELDWMDLQSIDWNIEAEIRGKVLAGKWTMQDRNGVMMPTALIKLDTADGQRVLWETARLTEFMEKLKPGDEVLIRHLGKVGIGGGRSIHNFGVGVKPHPERKNRPLALGQRPLPQPAIVDHSDQKEAVYKHTEAAQEADFDDEIPF